MKISRIIAAVMALVVAPLLMVSPVSMAAIPSGIAPMQVGPISGEDEDEDEECAPDENESSIIHIAHYEKSSSTDTGVGNGEEDTNASGTPIPGATFTLRKVTSVGGEDVPSANDLINGDASVEQIANISRTITPTTALEFGAQKSADTNPQGKADFSDLEFGLYEVEETKAPQGYTKVGKFYVILPSTPTADKCDFKYEAYYYPKSEKDPTLEKTVKDDTATSIGSPISYTLKGSVSSAEPGKYEISDQLSQKIKLKSVTVKIGDQALEAADYTLGGELNKAGQAVVVTLTDAGLAKLKTAYEASPDVKVSVDINGEVAAIPGADNIVLKNKASLKPSSDSKWDTSPVLSNEVATKFGGIKIHKVDYLKESQSLAGAKFKVYATKADAEAQEHELKFLNAEGTETTEAETDGEGNAIIEGLHVSDFANGKAAAQPTTYWVRETVAPEGYSVLPEPVEVTVASTADANNAGLVALTDKQIEDVAVNAKFRIPNTGLYGPFGYVLVGGLVIIIGAVVFIARRDR